MSSATPRRSHSLTYMQKHLWLLHHTEGINGAYNNVFGVYFNGDLDDRAFNQAVYIIVQRHESLRTLFGMTDEGPVQYILDAKEADPVPEMVDLREQEDADLELDRIIRYEQHFSYDLGSPLFRCKLIRLTDERYVGLFNWNYMVGDDTSARLFLREFCGFYDEQKGAGKDPVRPLTMQLKDHAAWQQEAAFERRMAIEEAYWFGCFDDPLTALNFPFDRSCRDTHSSVSGHAEFTLTPMQSQLLEGLARRHDTDVFTLILAIYKIFLGKLCNVEDVAVVIPVAGRDTEELAALIGPLENFIVIRTMPVADLSFPVFLSGVKTAVADALHFQNYPYPELLRGISPGGAFRKRQLPNAFFSFEGDSPVYPDPYGLTMTPCAIIPGKTLYDLACIGSKTVDGIKISLQYPVDCCSKNRIERFILYFKNVFSDILSDPDRQIAGIDILGIEEKSSILYTCHPRQAPELPEKTIASLFEYQVERCPSDIAVVASGAGWTYADLNMRANQLAGHLRETDQAGTDVPIAILCRRSAGLAAGLLAILKSGSILVPIDPSFSRERIEYILEDSQAAVLLIDDGVCPDLTYSGTIVRISSIENEHRSNPERPSGDNGLCCLLYEGDIASGVRGVMLTHVNLMSLFLAMNEVIHMDGRDCMLYLSGLASGNFILELIWPLCHGIEVVIHPPDAGTGCLDRYTGKGEHPMDFSLFFFANYNVRADNKYKLLLDAVRYADQHGLKGVWVPERHFHEFGGLFPNPSVLSAALAMITSRIELRSGSIVSPLHDVIRIAEEWAVVDNLSGGRVSLSFAPGWNINDFALSRNNYEHRHRIMHEQIETVKKLWSGERILRQNGQGKVIEVFSYPSPVQKSLPVWLTAAGNENTFIMAGEKGANILTHLLGQDINELAVKIRLYREARKSCGYDEKSGKVAIMLHTYVGDAIEEVERLVEKPFIEYLKSAVGLSRILYEEAGLKEDEIPEEDKEIMLRHSFKRYYKNASLIGTMENCREMVRKLHAIGVDDIACLVDFGIAPDKVMEGLKKLSSLNEAFAGRDDRLHKPVTMMLGSPPLDLYGHVESSIGNYLYGMEKLMAHSAIYVLNKELQLVPEGVEGDVYIGGQGIARGYWRKPAATKDSFIPNPFIKGERLFRTGDKGKWLPGGKFRLIRAVDGSVQREKGCMRPQTEVEEQLISMYAELLGIKIEDISTESSFFEMGAGDLTATRLMFCIRERFGTAIFLDQIYVHCSVRRLAVLLGRMGVGDARLIPAAGNRAYYPVSAAQEKIYNLRISDDPAIRNVVIGACTIRGKADITRLQHSFRSLLERQGGLRANFTRIGNAVFQYIREIADTASPELVEFDTMQAAVTALEKTFDLSGHFLVRGGWIRQDHGGTMLFIAADILVCDEDSIYILLNDLRRIYEGEQLSPLSLRYVDYAVWRDDQERSLDRQKAFWSALGATEWPELVLPVIKDKQGIDCRLTDGLSFTIDEASGNSIGQLAKDARTSPFSVFLSCFYILLSGITQETNIVVDARINERIQTKLKEVAGVFEHILPLPIVVEGGMSYSGLLQQVGKHVLEVAENQRMSYEGILAALGKNEAANVLFEYHDHLEFRGLINCTGKAEGYEMGVKVYRRGNIFHGEFLFCGQLFDADTIGQFKVYYLDILTAVLSDRQVAIENIAFTHSLKTV